MIELSSKVKSVSPSATIAISARVRELKDQGVDVISFGAGEPDFPTPSFIKEAAKAAIDADDTKYTPRAGAELKAAIVEKLKRENNLEYTLDEILVTFGGKHALYNAFTVLLEPGDKVLIPSPYWVSYPEQVKLNGGECIFIPTGIEKGFKITPRDILDNADGAKIIIINSPNNPTGITYSPEELKALADAILQTDLIIFSDEIYEKLVYNGMKHVSFAALDERLKDRTLTFNSYSKAYSMTGWRIGWVGGPKDVIKAMATVGSHQTTNPVSFVQAAALAAYTAPESPETIEQMRQQFQQRGKRMFERLNAIPGVRCLEPTGAFYCFPDISAHYGKTFGDIVVNDSLDFARACLELAHVAVVPGIAFGEDRCIRLSFATSMEQIDKGLDRLEELLNE